MKIRKKKGDIPIYPLPFVPPGGAMSGVSTDPQGSYTGVPEEKEEQPVQDVDDL